jgi:hypothetical protein
MAESVDLIFVITLAFEVLSDLSSNFLVVIMNILNLYSVIVKYSITIYETVALN